MRERRPHTGHDKGDCSSKAIVRPRGEPYAVEVMKPINVNPTSIATITTAASKVREYDHAYCGNGSDGSVLAVLSESSTPSTSCRSLQNSRAVWGRSFG